MKKQLSILVLMIFLLSTVVFAQETQTDSTEEGIYVDVANSNIEPSSDFNPFTIVNLDTNKDYYPSDKVSFSVNFDVNKDCINTKVGNQYKNYQENYYVEIRENSKDGQLITSNSKLGSSATSKAGRTSTTWSDISLQLPGGIKPGIYIVVAYGKCRLIQTNIASVKTGSEYIFTNIDVSNKIVVLESANKQKECEKRNGFCSINNPNAILSNGRVDSASETGCRYTTTTKTGYTCKDGKFVIISVECKDSYSSVCTQTGYDTCNKLIVRNTEGISCGDNKFCESSKCVDKSCPEKVIEVVCDRDNRIEILQEKDCSQKKNEVKDACRIIVDEDSSKQLSDSDVNTPEVVNECSKDEDCESNEICYQGSYSKLCISSDKLNSGDIERSKVSQSDKSTNDKFTIDFKSKNTLMIVLSILVAIILIGGVYILTRKRK